MASLRLGIRQEGGVNWKTIDKAKLETEIDRYSVQLDEATRGATATKDVAMAVRAASLLATHNALVSVFNSLN